MSYDKGVRPSPIPRFSNPDIDPFYLADHYSANADCFVQTRACSFENGIGVRARKLCRDVRIVTQSICKTRETVFYAGWFAARMSVFRSYYQSKNWKMEQHC